jgi:hypothetical protein
MARGALVLAALALLASAAALHRFASARETPESPAPPDFRRPIGNIPTVEITTTTPAWTKERLVVTIDRLRTDPALWRQMHFNDWDKVPQSIREPALRSMVRASARIFQGPDVWQAMTIEQWDDVPQPIRAMAYLRMIWHWTEIEGVGEELGYEPPMLAPTVSAIVMAESWFEHRAVNENLWGNRDLGLAQCSDYCRATIAAMARSGAIDFAPAEADYFEPLVATRVATVWFERELRLAGGDVNLAIRAYHRGIDNAMDERGDVYLARVRRLRERYIRTQRASASWRFITMEIGRRFP